MLVSLHILNTYFAIAYNLEEINFIKINHCEVREKVQHVGVTALHRADMESHRIL